MLDVFVPEICLQRPRVVASVRQRIAAGVPEHVWMGLKSQLCLDGCPLDHPSEAGGRERRSTL